MAGNFENGGLILLPPVITELYINIKSVYSNCKGEQEAKNFTNVKKENASRY